MPEPGAGALSQLSFDVVLQPEAIVVRCAGRLTFETGNILRTEVRKLIQPKGRVVLDLTGVTYCDSMGLGSVISLYVTSKSVGCRLELINLGQKVRQLFSMANVLSLFEVAADSSCRIP